MAKMGIPFTLTEMRSWAPLHSFWIPKCRHRWGSQRVAPIYIYTCTPKNKPDILIVPKRAKDWHWQNMKPCSRFTEESIATPGRWAWAMWLSKAVRRVWFGHMRAVVVIDLFASVWKKLARKTSSFSVLLHNGIQYRGVALYRQGRENKIN